MANGAQNSTRQANTSGLGTQAYVMAVICLLVGIAIGYFARGGDSGTATPTTANAAPSAPQGMGGGGMGQNVSPEQMKHMADKQAEPLLAQLKTNPNDAGTLAKVGDIYYDTQNYQEAIEYYKKSLAIRESSMVRTDMGTSIWYLGDPDAAIREFNAALKTDPKNVNTYFNMGMVKWQGKMDSTGAVEAWQKALQIEPNHPQRSQIEQLIAQAKKHMNVKPGQKTEKPTS